ncbi:LysE family translocator [Pseudovibrio sp. Ad37]|uniref:LysE family translocator n=1 Tax=Pseudovibrio sp. Ad37 TaxID=989422 RepID=UPI0007AEB52D|nr:LysE family translocator [Pseudovibrio sp. Ad37]KZL20162.1 Leucine efflux protein [Pseudovibrio sp. Ad37]
MSLDTLLEFTVASIVITLIPGPSVLLVTSQALTKGRLAAQMCILGDVIGTIVLIIISFMGLGAILATSAILFQLVKWTGVLYLAYLGYRQIMDSRHLLPMEFASDADLTSSWKSFWIGSITAVFNPKAIVFYMAFLAQFIEPTNNTVLQLGILILISVSVIFILLSLYALIAMKARKHFTSKLFRKRIGYTGGGLMITGSIWMAATR